MSYEVHRNGHDEPPRNTDSLGAALLLVQFLPPQWYGIYDTVTRELVCEVQGHGDSFSIHDVRFRATAPEPGSAS